MPNSNSNDISHHDFITILDPFLSIHLSSACLVHCPSHLTKSKDQSPSPAFSRNIYATLSPAASVRRPSSAISHPSVGGKIALLLSRIELRYPGIQVWNTTHSVVTTLKHTYILTLSIDTVHLRKKTFI